MDARDEKNINDLPQSAREFIKLITKKMRYRKSVRRDVQAELTAHFEDELHDCTDLRQREQKAKELIDNFGDAKLLGILLRRAKKRCRPLWRTVVARTFQTIGVFVICLILYTIWFLTGKPAITTDYLTELNHLVQPVADDSLNAAPFFDEAVAVCPNMPSPAARFWGKGYLDANDTERKTIQDWVEQCSDSLDMIAKGVEKPHFWRKYETGKGPNDDGSLINVLMPHLADFRKLAKAICSGAQIKAGRGEYSQAFNDLITCYKFGRLIGQGDKTIIEQLVGIAIQALTTSNIRSILAEYELDSQQLASLQTDFSEARAGQEFRMRLLNEKLMVFDEIQRCFTDGVGGGHPYPKRLLELGQMWEGDIEVGVVLKSMFFHPNKAQTKQRADAFYNFIEEASKMNPAELREKEIDLGEQAGSMVEGNIFLRMLTPALGKVHQLAYRIKTDVEATQTIIAVIRYKQGEGSFPEGLEQLKQAGFIEQIPLDSFSNQPLVYERTDEGFKLYSVGLNFVDDGGKVHHKDGRVRLWDDEEGDAVFWPVQK